MKLFRLVALVLLASLAAMPALDALEKQSAAEYHARRVALSAALHGGIAVLFAGQEPVLDFMPYRQDADFYYLTGWNEPGAALLVVDANTEKGRETPYREILFLPTRDLRTEKYTGAKLDAVSPGVTHTTGVNEVQDMTTLPVVLNKLIASNRRIARNLWTQP